MLRKPEEKLLSTVVFATTMGHKNVAAICRGEFRSGLSTKTSTKQQTAALQRRAVP